MNATEHKLYQMALALMFSALHDERRAWKAIPFEITDRLYAQGLIDDPRSHRQSMCLTDLGLERAKAASMHCAVNVSPIRSVARSMGNYWSVHLPHFLAPNGTLAPVVGRGLRLAKYWTEIVAQASNYEEPTTIRCRRRPERRPCSGLLTLFFDADTFDVLWFCPVCEDNGRISGWEGTFWDNSEMTETTS